MTDAFSADFPSTQSAAVTRIPPSAEVREELTQLLQDDERLLGEVYRHLREGKTAKEIAEQMDYPTPTYVYLYRRQIVALLDGELPAAPSLASQVARKLSAIVKWKDLSPSAREHLEQLLSRLERQANDEQSIEAEDSEARHQTARAESRQEVGIYVYALPHYLRHPVEPASGRTLMKVGHSGADIISRFRSQARTTALPEAPVLLRIYHADERESIALEREFHSLLDAADHVRSSTKSAGREWFVTHLKYLDQIAKSLKLQIKEVADVGMVGE